MIKLTRNEWRKVENQLKEEYKDMPSVFLIRSTMKRVLGFTTRQHNHWSPDAVVYLDFFDEQKETVFILKYL